jgi:3-deoxy-manno-octulosonate cytidylyltransferase (CMP-KDO synthetase)
MTRVLIVIPARYGSQRLAGKMLLAETGKPLLQHTWERASAVGGADVVIATDDPRIEEAARGFGADVEMTSPDHQSGSTRAAEVAERRRADIVVNCQGDEPEVNPAHITRLIEGQKEAMRAEHPVFASTVACPFPEELDAANPNTVKVVTTGEAAGAIPRAIYFSRSLLPFPRTREHRPLLHIGLYAFSAATIQTFASMPQGQLEVTESLEQLRILEAGHSMAVFEVDGASTGIDTREDYDAFVARTLRDA